MTYGMAYGMAYGIAYDTAYGMAYGTACTVACAIDNSQFPWRMADWPVVYGMPCFVYDTSIVDSPYAVPLAVHHPRKAVG